MSYQGTRATRSKFAYAQVIAACLAHLAIDQGDRPGLWTISGQVERHHDVKRSIDLGGFCHVLEHLTLAGGDERLADLEELARQNQRPGLVIVLSDLLCDLAELESVLRVSGSDVTMLRCYGYLILMKRIYRLTW